jgi:hypothetical protein
MNLEKKAQEVAQELHDLPLYEYESFQRVVLAALNETHNGLLEELIQQFQGLDQVWIDKNAELPVSNPLSTDYVYGYNLGCADGFKVVLAKLRALKGEDD